MDAKQPLLSPELAHRLAAIDIGTNSIRLMVAEPLRGGNYRILDEEKVSPRLGHSLGRTGHLETEGMDKALVALRRMKQIAEGFQVSQLKTIATCAVREALNGAEFCRRAKEEVGLEIEVISARQEALLAFFSVQRAFDLKDAPVAVADIGGGSTEIVLALGGLVEAIYTTQLGAVRLSEMFGADMAGEEFGKLVEMIDRHLRKHTRNPVFVPHLLFGSGGTFTSLASMAMASKGQANQPLRGYQVTRAEVRHLLDRVRKTPAKQRAAIPGLSPDRADIIVAGLAIVDRVMDRFSVNLLQVHNRGVRDGLLLTMIDHTLGTGAASPDRESAIERLAASGGEVVHGRHVARLAGEIFDQLAGPARLDPGDRPLLVAAARLQDVGYLINYDQHHKHSYHLILNSRLEGFSPHELELVANIARYHRGAGPKKKHANFAALTPADQQRVRRLAAILRLAGGLDRSNTQLVERVELIHGPKRIDFVLYAPQDPEVDLWAAHRRSDEFSRAFDVAVDFRWHNQPAAESTANGHATPNGRRSRNRSRRG